MAGRGNARSSCNASASPKLLDFRVFAFVFVFLVLVGMLSRSPSTSSCHSHAVPQVNGLIRFMGLTCETGEVADQCPRRQRVATHFFRGRPLARDLVEVIVQTGELREKFG